MPDNLRITAPIPTSEGVGKPNAPKEPANVDAVNPASVPRPNTQGQDAGGRSPDLLLDPESVYGKFVRQLRRTPPLRKTLGKALGDAAAAQERQAAQQAGASPLRQLAKGLPMEREDVLADLESQQENGSAFQGPFFHLLRLLSENGADAGFDLQLAGFLKAYDAFRNAGATTESILRDLQTIEGQIPRNDAADLKALAEKLRAGEPAEDAPANLGVLKKEILPLLGRYVARTNDYGRSRDSISFLLHHVTMLEAGVKENVSGSFRKLLEAAKFSLDLPDGSVRAMQSLFAAELSGIKQKRGGGFPEILSSVLEQHAAKAQKAGSASSGETVLQDICNALLLDSSVYMPFAHLFLPFVYDGRYLFAQIWVEKDDGSDRPAELPAERAPLRVYLSFEIQNLGHFEAAVELLGENAELSLGCPPSLDGSRKEIREQLSGIFERNGLRLEKAELAPCGEPKIEREILKKIEERKRAVNVTV